ncbi:MAG: HlyD family efflux transporter periplasmic adaptor subunit, partial [Gemmobacter sp.]|nr:HlyD family efflux transporter periplasmic adaptor subunit [Gemmobacter sp.]
QVRGADKGASPIARERVFAATVVPFQLKAVTPELTVFGEVRSRRTLDLRAPRAGTVVTLAEGFEDGAPVAAGQVLVRLDPSDAIAARDLMLADQTDAVAEARDAARALELAHDELAAAQAQAALRAQALTRQRSLLERGAGSDAAVETAALAGSAADQAVLSRRQAVAQAETRVEKAAATRARLIITLAEAERAIRETELVAGFAGLLSEVVAIEGGIVSQNERLARLVDPAALEVTFRLSTEQFRRLVTPDGDLIDTPVTVVLDVPGAEIVTSGHLTRVGAAVGEGQTGRLIYATLDAAGGFRPGDFVTVHVQEPVLEQVAVLPATALGSGDTLLVLGADDRLEEVAVELLRRQGDLVILRADGLGGREVVAERTAQLGGGLRIRPIRPEASAAGSASQDIASTAEQPSAAAGLIDLTPERRAALIAYVEANTRMPNEAKVRILAQLSQPQVPAQVISRLESRMGG